QRAPQPRAAPIGADRRPGRRDGDGLPAAQEGVVLMAGHDTRLILTGVNAFSVMWTTAPLCGTSGGHEILGDELLGEQPLEARRVAAHEPPAPGQALDVARDVRPPGRVG